MKTKKDALEGIITREDMEVKYAKITKALLNFIDVLRAKIKKSADGFDEVVMTDPPIFEGKKQILLLYAMDDKLWLEKINKHLFLLKRQSNLHFVDLHADVPLSVSDVDFYQEKLIDVAYKVLCLVTPNCFSPSLYPLIEKASLDGKLIPIKIATIDIENTVFAKIQGLPSNQKFITEWPDENSGFVDIATALRQFFGKK